MFKQVFLPILACIVFITIVGIFTQKYKGGKIDLFSNNPKVTASSQATHTIKVNGKELAVEVARTDSERQKGLSQRAVLEENTGMLFVFETKNVTPSFWMKDMLIPLDLIWIKDGKIIKIDKNAPVEKDTPDNKLKIYSTGEPINYVLEVNASFSDKNGIKVGDSVEISL